MTDRKQLLKSLPKVDVAVERLSQVVKEDCPYQILKLVVAENIEKERQQILSDDSKCRLKSFDEWVELFQIKVAEKLKTNLRRIVNGTGVVVHTNLGRSLLPGDAGKMLVQAATHYSNLEFNLQTGKRGSRYSLVEDMICELTGAEAALVVNNNAAAVLLTLETLAKDTEVIVSRGQLVEIGGSFRIPDVMAKSGAKLVEVGATNRTHLKDYRNGITENTSILLKVHCSNYRMIGFTKEVSMEEMVELAREKDLLVMEDLGSGCLIDLSPYGLPKEPTVGEVVRAGVDVVTFSGDKMLGGPQAGIIVGHNDVIERVKKNPMNRALRIDKFTLAALESILRYYYDTEKALKGIPTLAMLSMSPDLIKKRGQRLQRRIKKSLSSTCRIQLLSTVSRVGGGSMPEYSMDSWAVSLTPLTMSLSQMERKFRSLDVPIIGRIEDNRFLLDMRTIQDYELADLADSLKRFFSV